MINSLGLPCRGALGLGLNPSLPDGHGTSKTSPMITSYSRRPPPPHHLGTVKHFGVLPMLKTGFSCIPSDAEHICSDGRDEDVFKVRWAVLASQQVQGERK